MKSDFGWNTSFNLFAPEFINKFLFVFYKNEIAIYTWYRMHNNIQNTHMTKGSFGLDKSDWFFRN